MELFEARNLLYERIKRLPGFDGLNVNAKTGVYGTLVIYVKDEKTKETFKKMLGEQQYGYYISYVQTEGLRFL